MAFGIMVVHAILSPVLAVFDQLELLAAQRMERMRYAEVFARTALMRCN